MERNESEFLGQSLTPDLALKGKGSHESKVKDGPGVASCREISLSGPFSFTTLTAMAQNLSLMNQGSPGCKTDDKFLYTSTL